jgi:hypothetical protein
MSTVIGDADRSRGLVRTRPTVNVSWYSVKLSAAAWIVMQTLKSVAFKMKTPSSGMKSLIPAKR